MVKAKAKKTRRLQAGAPQDKAQNESAFKGASKARHEEARSVAAKAIVRDAENLLKRDLINGIHFPCLDCPSRPSCARRDVIVFQIFDSLHLKAWTHQRKTQ